MKPNCERPNELNSQTFQHWSQIRSAVHVYTEALYLIFAVEKQQVCKGDGGEGRLLQQERQFLKAL